MQSINSTKNKNAINFTHRGTKADIGVIKQIFQNKDYDIRNFKQGERINNIYKSLTENNIKPLILDLGANIGASAVFFGMTYPNSKIVAIEPNKSNFDILKKNTNHLDIISELAAIDSENGTCILSDPGEGEWGYRTIENKDGVEVNKISLRDITFNMLHKGHIPLICKIDIEGAEINLFKKNLEWIDLFPLIIIELHDWMLPKQQTSINFLKAMAERDRDFVHKGENIFSFRNF